MVLILSLYADNPLLQCPIPCVWLISPCHPFYHACRKNQRDQEALFVTSSTLVTVDRSGVAVLKIVDVVTDGIDGVAVLRKVRVGASAVTVATGGEGPKVVVVAWDEAGMVVPGMVVMPAALGAFGIYFSSVLAV